LATVTMPQLGETVTEGTVGRWLKKVGDNVQKYEPLLEVETDKVASEIPSPFAGVLTKIHVEEGTTVPVGAAVCEIGDAVASSASTQDAATPQASGAPQTTSAGVTPASPTSVQNIVGGGMERGAPTDGVRYSPAVRKLAREHRVDLRQLSGSGRGGRVTAKDVLIYVDQGAVRFSPGVAAASSAPAKAVSPAAPAHGDTTIRVTQMRKTIAEHMVLSKTTVPHAWSMVEADVTDLVKWREAEKTGFKAREGVNLTFLPLVVLAVCESLREFPMVNATWAGDRIIVRELDRLMVYGREGGLAIYELLGLAEGGAAPSWAAVYERGLAAYRARDFAAAGNSFQEVLVARPGDQPARIMRARSREFLHSPPGKDWEAANALKVK